MIVKLRGTHTKKLAGESRVIMTSGVIGQEASATRNRALDSVGQATSGRTRLAASR